jgi:TolA-binding protein
VDNLVKPSSDQIGTAAHAYLSLAKCYEAKGETNEALNAYFKVIALYPEPSSYPEAVVNAAILLANGGKSERALKLLSDVIENYPTSDFAKQAVALRDKIIAKGKSASSSGKKF